jgi:hypothetical protein
MSDSLLPLDYGEQLVRRYWASGLTRKEFAEQADISVSKLDYYVRRERGTTSLPGFTPNRIVPMDLVLPEENPSGPESACLPSDNSLHPGFTKRNRSLFMMNGPCRAAIIPDLHWPRQPLQSACSHGVCFSLLPTRLLPAANRLQPLAGCPRSTPAAPYLYRYRQHRHSRYSGLLFPDHDLGRCLYRGHGAFWCMVRGAVTFPSTHQRSVSVSDSRRHPHRAARCSCDPGVTRPEDLWQWSRGSGFRRSVGV